MLQLPVTETQKINVEKRDGSSVGKSEMSRASEDTEEDIRHVQETWDNHATVSREPKDCSSFNSKTDNSRSEDWRINKEPEDFRGFDSFVATPKGLDENDTIINDNGCYKEGNQLNEETCEHKIEDAASLGSNNKEQEAEDIVLVSNELEDTAEEQKPDNIVPETYGSEDTPEDNVSETNETEDTVEEDKPKEIFPETHESEDAVEEHKPEDIVFETNELEDTVEEDKPEEIFPGTLGSEDTIEEDKPKKVFPETHGSENTDEEDEKDKSEDIVSETNEAEGTVKVDKTEVIFPETHGSEDSVEDKPEDVVSEMNETEDTIDNPKGIFPETHESEDTVEDDKPKGIFPETDVLEDTVEEDKPEDIVSETNESDNTVEEDKPEEIFASGSKGTVDDHKHEDIFSYGSEDSVDEHKPEAIFRDTHGSEDAVEDTAECIVLEDYVSEEDIVEEQKLENVVSEMHQSEDIVGEHTAKDMISETHGSEDTIEDQNLEDIMSKSHHSVVKDFSDAKPDDRNSPDNEDKTLRSSCSSVKDKVVNADTHGAQALDSQASARKALGSKIAPSGKDHSRSWVANNIFKDNTKETKPKSKLANAIIDHEMHGQNLNVRERPSVGQRHQDQRNTHHISVNNILKSSNAKDDTSAEGRVKNKHQKVASSKERVEGQASLEEDPERNVNSNAPNGDGGTSKTQSGKVKGDRKLTYWGNVQMMNTTWLRLLFLLTLLAQVCSAATPVPVKRYQQLHFCTNNASLLWDTVTIKNVEHYRVPGCSITVTATQQYINCPELDCKGIVVNQSCVAIYTSDLRSSQWMMMEYGRSYNGKALSPVRGGLYSEAEVEDIIASYTGFGMSPPSTSALSPTTVPPSNSTGGTNHWTYLLWIPVSVVLLVIGVVVILRFSHKKVTFQIGLPSNAENENVKNQLNDVTVESSDAVQIDANNGNPIIQPNGDTVEPSEERPLVPSQALNGALLQ